MGKMRLKACFAGALLLGACAAGEDAGEVYGAPLYDLADCRRVALVDAESGERVRGAEDLALDAGQGRLFLSAYDRRAVEKSARKKRDMIPHGGVYAISLDTLFDPETEEVTVSSLAAPKDFAGGLRPHGLSYDEENHELVFINRTYVRDGRRWRMEPHLQRIGANGEMFVGAPAPAHCAANDVSAGTNSVVTSFDHASCGFGAGLENIFRLKRSGIADENGPLFTKAAFANGVARLDNGGIAMAATRESAILLLEPAEDGFSERARILLPGRPDNLTVSADGTIVAALHPSLSKLASARKLGFGRAPSRIVKALPESGAIEILFDDPEGDVFSAATAAVETEQGLVAGSVVDEGLLVCRKGA
ncbi:hypothetical protein [Hyphococcus sp.]|jgi:hypothetical protein|uniref:hypothetical protein n=1 Tax=Hyphococcus sp. TaxID=2038636 RepID=UPI003D0F28D6